LPGEKHPANKTGAHIIRRKGVRQMSSKPSLVVVYLLSRAVLGHIPFCPAFLFLADIGKHSTKQDRDFQRADNPQDVKNSLSLPG